MFFPFWYCFVCRKRNAHRSHSRKPGAGGIPSTSSTAMIFPPKCCGRELVLVTAIHDDELTRLLS